MSYAPGFELEARMFYTRESQLAWLGYASRRTGDPSLPTITHAALEAQRLTGDRNGPIDPEAAKELAAEPEPAHSWVKVCLDSTGAVTKADDYETTSSKASKAFVAAARMWRFRPFTVQGRPIPVCAMVRMTFPTSTAAEVETLPMPPPPSRGKKTVVVLAGSKFIEGHRTHGKTNLAPDDPTKRELKKRAIKQISGAFRLCLDDAGVPESVLPMRSTPFAEYDAKLMAGMRERRYAPYQIDDHTVPVCTKIVFAYTQR
jgi:hypothetical protein